jgi:hypothetical protein
MDESDGPRVFEEGAITQVIGANGFNLYIGSLHIKHVERIEITTGGKNPVVKIKFQSGRSRDIEENARLVKTLPWVNIV